MVAAERDQTWPLRGPKENLARFAILVGQGGSAEVWRFEAGPLDPKLGRSQALLVPPGVDGERLAERALVEAGLSVCHLVELQAWSAAAAEAALAHARLFQLPEWRLQQLDVLEALKNRVPFRIELWDALEQLCQPASRPEVQYGLRVHLNLGSSLIYGTALVPDGTQDSMVSLADQIGGSLPLMSQDHEERREAAPPLFNLTTLAQHLHGASGHAPSDVAMTARLLFERGAISYPDLDATSFPQWALDSKEAILTAIEETCDGSVDLTSSPDVREPTVEDEYGACGLVPSLQRARFSSILEVDVYQAIAMRFLAQFKGSFAYRCTTLTFQAASLEVTAELAQVHEPGWTSVEPARLQAYVGGDDLLPRLPERWFGTPVEVLNVETCRRFVPSRPAHDRSFSPTLLDDLVEAGLASVQAGCLRPTQLGLEIYGRGYPHAALLRMRLREIAEGRRSAASVAAELDDFFPSTRPVYGTGSQNTGGEETLAERSHHE